MALSGASGAALDGDKAKESRRVYEQGVREVAGAVEEAEAGLSAAMGAREQRGVGQMAMTILLVAGGGAVLALALAGISRVLALLLGEE